MKLHSFFESLRELRTFLLLFTTQALSSLGSAMTSYALVIWAYISRAGRRCPPRC